MNKLSPVSVIIQARMGSTRLPGKVMMPFVGKPDLWHVVNRIKKSRYVDQIIIATTTLVEDNIIEEYCIDNNWLYFRGSSDDVLARYYFAAKQFSASTVVRITADCPVIDFEVLDSVLGYYLKKNEKCWELDYITDEDYPIGLSVEVFRSELLERAFLSATIDYEREHVTPYFYRNPELFKIEKYRSNELLSHLRWTLDTQEDYRLLSEIYERLYEKNNDFVMKDVLQLMENNPELKRINENIRQKTLGE